MSIIIIIYYFFLNVAVTIHLFFLFPTKLKESSPLQGFDKHGKIFLKESLGVLRALVRNVALIFSWFSSMPCLPHNFSLYPYTHSFPTDIFLLKWEGKLWGDGA